MIDQPFAGEQIPVTNAHDDQTLSKRQFLAEFTIIALVFLVAIGCLGGAAYYVIVVRAQIAPGDTLSIQVEGFPALSGEARVNDAGQIRVQEIGMVGVSGMSVRDAESLIAELLGGAMRTTINARVEKQEP